MYNNSYLIHFGIKGQKWGVRHWQNPDGTFNEAGKKRYFNVDVNKKQETYDEINKKFKNLKNKNTFDMSDEEYLKYQKDYSKLKDQVRLAKKDLKDEKIKDILNNEKTKSRLKSEEEFKKQGFSDEEAAIAAYKKEKAQKIILAAAGLTIAAAAAYGAYKYYDYAADKTIKEGSVFKRVSIDGSTKLHDAFYAAKDRDANKYVGMYGDQIRSHHKGDINQKILKVTDNIKVASEKNGLKTLKELIENNDINSDDIKQRLIQRQQFYDKVGMAGSSKFKKIEKAIDALNNNKINKDVYDAFNVMLSDNGHKDTKTFYDALRSKGYDAIRDVNDRSLSGYNAKTAHIFIDNSKMIVDKVNKITNDQINRELKNIYKNNDLKETVKANVKGLMPHAALLVSGTAATTAYTNHYNRKKDNEIIEKYKKEHPDSKLSRNEILINYYGDKK